MVMRPLCLISPRLSAITATKGVAKECRALRNQENKNRKSTRRIVPVETLVSSALVSYDGLEGYDWSDQAEYGPTNFALMPYSFTSSKSEIDDKYKKCLGYNAVLPPSTRNFLPLKPDLSGLQEFMNESIVSEPIAKKPRVETNDAKASADKPKVIRKNFSPLLIKDWISDSKDEVESKPKIEKKTIKSCFAKIEFVKSKEQVKSPRKTTVKQVKKPMQHTHRPRGNQRNQNNMMSQRLGTNFEMYNKACYEWIVLKICKNQQNSDNIYTRSEATKKSQIKKQFFIK
nr:hypothetical protein [Tanacetum cinerariifolium]